MNRLTHGTVTRHDTDRPGVDTALGRQEAQRCLNIAGHPIHHFLPLFFRVRVPSGLALAKTTEIECQHVVASGVKHRCQVIVDATIAIALVQQK